MYFGICLWAHHSGRTLTPEEERESEWCFPLAQGVEAAHQGLVTHETVQPVVTAADFSSNNRVEPSKFGQIKLPVRECVFSVSYTQPSNKLIVPTTEQTWSSLY